MKHMQINNIECLRDSHVLRQVNHIGIIIFLMVGLVWNIFSRIEFDICPFGNLFFSQENPHQIIHFGNVETLVIIHSSFILRISLLKPLLHFILKITNFFGHASGYHVSSMPIREAFQVKHMFRNCAIPMQRVTSLLHSEPHCCRRTQHVAMHDPIVYYKKCNESDLQGFDL